jgi:predicted small lipoprotein YifL
LIVFLAQAHVFDIVPRPLESLVFATAPSLPQTSRIALAVAVGLAATGCGRIGPLEPPSNAAAPVKPPSSAVQGSVEAISPQVKPRIPPITPPNQTFILDPLLK